MPMFRIFSKATSQEKYKNMEKREVANRYFKVAVIYLRLNFFYARAKMSTERLLPLTLVAGNFFNWEMTGFASARLDLVDSEIMISVPNSLFKSCSREARFTVSPITGLRGGLLEQGERHSQVSFAVIPGLKWGISEAIRPVHTGC